MNIKKLITKIDNWDQNLILKYNGLGGRPLTLILKFFSFFGRETLWIFLIVFYLLIWYDRFLLSYISATFLTGLILILSIKQKIKRSRPFERLPEINALEHHPTSRSFPSWHSYNIISQGLLIGLFFLNSMVVTIFFILLGILVSISRIQLGVHYPSDVIMGSLFGAIGFIIATCLIGPLIHHIFIYLEAFITFKIQYQQFNSWLYTNVGYFLLCLCLLGVIIILAIHKSIKVKIKKKAQ